eukprot:6853614-Prymnesium_polylepis.1
MAGRRPARGDRFGPDGLLGRGRHQRARLRWRDGAPPAASPLRVLPAPARDAPGNDQWSEGLAAPLHPTRLAGSMRLRTHTLLTAAAATPSPPLKKATARAPPPPAPRSHLCTRATLPYPPSYTHLSRALAAFGCSYPQPGPQASDPHPRAVAL